ncbi:hypothetical protein LINPERHAP1_LOCUS35052 [Linum perenne]
MHTTRLPWGGIIPREEINGMDECHEEGNGEDELSDDGSLGGEKVLKYGDVEEVAARIKNGLRHQIVEKNVSFQILRILLKSKKYMCSG